MQGGGYGGSYGGGMGNGNGQVGAGNGWNSRSSGYGMGDEANGNGNGEMNGVGSGGMPQYQQGYASEMQRAASPLHRVSSVSSGYGQRGMMGASPVAYSPAMHQQNGSTPSHLPMPPLNLNPQYNMGRSSVQASPVTDAYNPGQYMYNSPMPSSPYTPYSNEQNDVHSHNAQANYGGPDLKHRVGVNPNDWNMDMQMSGHSPSAHRRTLSPVKPSHMGGYNTHTSDYGYNYGSPPRKNKLHSLKSFFLAGSWRYLFILLLPSTWLIFSAIQFGSGSVNLYPSSGKFDLTIGEKDLEKLGNGISVVGACMNRQERLEKVLGNWLGITDAKEIIIVDWSSDPPLKPIVDKINDKRLKLVRVDDEEKWILSRAFNVGMQFASYEKVIRLDCDYVVAHNFSETHKLEEGKNFFSGDWQNARTENERHLNGAMHVHQKDFWKVMGYDERIQSYGWDDEDMYTRLANNAKLARTPVSYEDIVHYPHGDEARAQSGVKFVEVETDYNRIMLEKLPQWGPEMVEKSSYEANAHGNFYELKATKKPLSVANLTEESIREEAWALALGRRLHDTYTVPWEILQDLDIDNKELLLRNLMDRHKNSDDPPPRIIFGHCMHGLGNRLRALGSILSYAKSTNKELVIIWEDDEHCGAKFNELFSDSIVQMSTFKPKYPFKDHEKLDTAWSTIDKYNYMELEEGANKGEIITDDPSKHTYYKGAYIMEAPGLSSWETDNENLRLLTPVPEVTEILKQYEGKDFKNYVGVHIRNRDLSKDIQNVDFSKEYTPDASNTMDYWRHKSHYKNFIDRMKQIQAQDPDVNFYVASDTWEIQKEMEREFDGHIFTTERTCDDRDASCVRYALADLYNLGRTSKMLGSNWSSFTEAAQRLGGIQAELAGQDFAADPNGPPS